MTDGTESYVFGPSPITRLVRLSVTMLSMSLAGRVFAKPPTWMDVGLALIVWLICALIMIIVATQVIKNAALLTASPEGLQLNWFTQPIPWELVQSSRLIEASGFSFGMSWIELNFSDDLEVPITDPETSLRASSDLDWFIDLAVYGLPVWTMHSPRQMLIKVPKLDASAEVVLKVINQYVYPTRP